MRKMPDAKIRVVAKGQKPVPSGRIGRPKPVEIPAATTPAATTP